MVREVHSFHNSALRAEALEKAKYLLIDPLGASLAAAHTPEAQKMRLRRNGAAFSTPLPEAVQTPRNCWPRCGTGRAFGVSGVKPYPCCSDNYSAVDVMLEFYQMVGGDLTKINAIGIRCIPEMYKMLANAAPKTMVEAQLSTPFCAAVALLDGRVGLQRFSGDFRIADDIQDAIDLITLRSDASLGQNAEPVIRDHVRQAEGLAASRDPIRQVPKGLPLRHRTGGNRHLLAMCPDPSSKQTGHCSS